jgi:hypothetical protein
MELHDLPDVELVHLDHRFSDRQSAGLASRDDLLLADRIITAFAGQYPRDGFVTIVDGEMSDDIDEEDDEIPG